MGMRTEPQRTIVCPDLHAPFHNQRAWDLWLEAAYRSRANRAVVIGDFFDLYSLSAHAKKADRRELFEDEIDAVAPRLDELNSLGIPVEFCGGNHEHRYARYIHREAPMLHGFAPHVADALGINARSNITYHEYREAYTLGSCDYVHEVGNISGKTALIRSADAYGGNVVFGHTHRVGLFTSGNYSKQNFSVMNVGWLGELRDIDYMDPRSAASSWQHGFGIVDTDEDGYAAMIPVTMKTDKSGNMSCMVDGKTVRG